MILLGLVILLQIKPVFKVDALLLDSLTLNSLADSIELDLCQSDSIFAKRLAEKIFDFYEEKGVIDPKVSIVFNSSDSLREVRVLIANERIVSISSLLLYSKEGTKSLRWPLKVFLGRNGVFSQKKFRATANFLSSAGILEVKGYFFEERNNSYAMVIKGEEPFFVPYCNFLLDNKGFRGALAFENTLFSLYPLRIGLNLLFSDTKINDLSMLIKVPLSFEHQIFSFTRLGYDSVFHGHITVGKLYQSIAFSAFLDLSEQGFKGGGIKALYTPRNFNIFCDLSFTPAKVHFHNFLSLSMPLGSSTANLMGYFSNKGENIPTFLGQVYIPPNTPYLEVTVSFKNLLFSRSLSGFGGTAIGIRQKVKDTYLYVGLSKWDDASFEYGTCLTLTFFKILPLVDFLWNYN